MSTGLDKVSSGSSPLHSDQREDEGRMNLKQRGRSDVRFDRLTRQEHDEQGCKGEAKVEPD